MKKTLFSALLLLGTTAFCFAQKPIEKGLNAITKNAAKAHIEFLADDALEGREAGFNGSRVAAQYIVSRLKELNIAPFFNDGYFQPFEAYQVDHQRKGRWQVDADSIAKLKQDIHRRLAMKNILAVIPGKNTSEYVMVGAHYDHLGTDVYLAGDQIYNGADDNASGVSAVLQIAKAFVESGKQPERTVIFAFWDGEEKGLLGSKYFVNSFDRIGQLKGYLNFDMIGRNNIPERPSQVVYFYTESNSAFGDWLKEDIKKYNLDLDPDYRPWDRPVGGSDNGPFAQKDVPIIWYHTNGHKDYHRPSDHAEFINWNKVVEITKASFLNMWHLANDKTY